MMRLCLLLSRKSRECEGEFEGLQVAKVRGGALVSAGAFFIARISQNKISDFARPSHASFKTSS
jgi:hypothetical protein